MVNDQSIGDRIRRRREYLDALRGGFTRDDVAAVMGLTRAGYAHWETGRRGIGGPDLAKLAKVLEVKVEYFFEDDEPLDADTRQFSDYTYEVTDRERDDLTSSIAGVPPEIRPAALAAFKALAKSLAEAKDPTTYGRGKGARTVVDPDIDGVVDTESEQK